MKNEKTMRIQKEKSIMMCQQEEQSIIMTEETYDNVKHMLNSYEDDVNGDHSIINKIEEDSFDHGLAEQLKGSIDISYNNSVHQDSVLTTLNLVKIQTRKNLRIGVKKYCNWYNKKNENEVWTNIQPQLNGDSAVDIEFVFILSYIILKLYSSLQLKKLSLT